MSLKLPAGVYPAKLHRIPSGTVLYRNHHRDYPGARFNPCLGGATRFAPLSNTSGGCIPTFYAATSFDGAAYETVFRGTPSRFTPIPRQDLDIRGVSQITPKAVLDLVPFFTPELIALGLDPAEFFRPSAKVYPDCRALAEMAWRDNPQAHGLIWTSVRDSSASAMIVFGDRLSEADFDHLGTREIATDSTLLDELVTAGFRAGFRIAR